MADGHRARQPQARHMGVGLLDRLAKSPISRGPAMTCLDPADEAEFVVSYPAEDSEQAGRDSIAYIRECVDALGWLDCHIRVDEVTEVDLEAELLEGP